MPSFSRFQKVALGLACLFRTHVPIAAADEAIASRAAAEKALATALHLEKQLHRAHTTCRPFSLSDTSPRMLVTGGAGFVGSHLVEALKREYPKATIKVADNLRRGRLTNLATDAIDQDDGAKEMIDFRHDICLEDLTKPDVSQRVMRHAEVVFHLADTVADSGLSAFDDALLINLEVIRAAKENGVKDFVYASTACTSPERNVTRISSEKSTYGGFSESPSHGCSKFMGEVGLGLAREESHMNVGIVRFSQIYGPRSPYVGGDSQALPSLIHQAIRLYTGGDARGLVVQGSGRQSRDFVYIDDAIDALLATYRVGMNEGPLQMGTGKATTLAEAAEEVANLANSLMGPLGDRLRPQFEASISEDDLGGAADVTQGTEVLKWRAATPFRDGLRRTFQWILADMIADYPLAGAAGFGGGRRSHGNVGANFEELHLIGGGVNGTIVTAKRQLDLPYLNLIRSYVGMHKAPVVNPVVDKKRRYIVAGYGCPHFLGNYVFNFLNAFAVALVTNRTLLWINHGRHIDKKGPSNPSLIECDGFMDVRSWVPAAEAVLPILEASFGSAAQARFPPYGYGFQGLKYLGTKSINEPNIGGDSLFVDSKQLFCADFPMDSGNSTLVLKAGWMERRDVGLSLRNGSGVLGPEAQSRVHQLFSHGIDVAYGMMFDAAFEMGKAVVGPAKQALLNAVDDSATGDGNGRNTIAIHVRHQDSSDHGNDSAHLRSCISSILEPNLAIFAASDRDETLAALSKIASKNSTVVKAPVKPMAHHAKGQVALDSGENGPAAGLGGLYDMEFLTEAGAHPRAIGFIGSTVSSFSELIYARIAFRQSADHNRTVYWEKGVDSVKEDGHIQAKCHSRPIRLPNRRHGAKVDWAGGSARAATYAC